jgi:hypothetical protein
MAEPAQPFALSCITCNPDGQIDQHDAGDEKMIMSLFMTALDGIGSILAFSAIIMRMDSGQCRVVTTS